MKPATWVIVSALLALAAYLFVGNSASDSGSAIPGRAWAGEPSSAKPADGSSGLPPLKVDRSAPLLLDALPETPPSKEDVADNLACYCCHLNYEGEPLVEIHAAEKIGCVKCHGESFDHRNDEDHVTPPDVMYPPEKIEAACLQCHETHDAPAKEVLARWQQRCPEKTDPAKLVCTDCHGEHRLTARTARWDKRTGEFLGGDKPAVPAEEAPIDEMR